MQILIVDDDVISLSLIENALASAGYDVITATNGREALDLLHDRPIRLVVADWDMPEVSGLELCRQVRKGDLSGYVYIILVTSYDSAERVVEGLGAGADDFITKPFNAAELIARSRVGERVIGLETRDCVIFALAKLAENRDLETGEHVERVQRYSLILARKLAEHPKYREVMDPDYIRLVALCSPLHDVGKVGIPDRILTKRGDLTNPEFELMKRHTTIGARTLESVMAKYQGIRFLEIARDIAATHHERYDGTGYPAGLRGDAIPLCGRIVALADVYDALTSKRCYKEAFNHAQAKSIILEGSAKQFDPDVVDAFLLTEDEFVNARDKNGAQTDPCALTA
jgi:putative two-component system response regulator